VEVVYLREKDALTALNAAVADVPEWSNVLRIDPVDLDGAQPTLN
jgi:hypothetical protein